MFTKFTNITDAVNFAFLFTLVISVGLLILITVLMVVFVVKYRRNKNPVPTQIESHAFLEVLWTLVPTVLVLGMFYYGWLGYKLMRTPPENAMRVTAVAQMWSWSFKYENGKHSSELYVPVQKPVRVDLESLDVIHSFYVPAFMVKMDVVPGLDTFVWFEPDEIGVYDIFCAEYCGLRHSYMLSKVNVVSEAEFNEWVQKDVNPVLDLAGDDVSDEERTAKLASVGKHLMTTKGCVACHSTDGSTMVGPTYRGLFGKTETVVTDGEARSVVVDEAYIRRSILDPMADLVDGFQPLMPPQQGLVTEGELEALVEYIKSVK